MKTRTSHVSNSSSSSFIIAYNDKYYDCPTCGIGKIDLHQLVGMSEARYCESEINADSWADIIKYIEENYNSSWNEDYGKTLITRCGETLVEHEDWRFLAFELDYTDSLTANIIEKLKNNKQLIILNESE